ncbi:MAG: methionyl-tRNA formyltransferase, partial [Pseudomonadota bacterium]|nr:methionyl-tRNA formyltransferase [Pseudomonadota bacterium]
LRIVLLGAVWSTEVALRSLAAAGHRPACLLTLPVENSARHSDFVDLGPVAEALDVPVLRVGDVNSEEVLGRLRELAPDVILVIGWSRICGPKFRQTARLGTLGYHPTLLPKLRGRAALAWTILLGLERTGASIFWLDDGVDSGPIAAQHEFELASNATLAQLIELHKEAIAAMIPPLFAALAAGQVPAVEQDHSQATYVALRRPEDGEIDWRCRANQIEQLVRAVSRPYPGAFTTLQSRRLIIWSAEVVSYPQWHAQTGQIFTYVDGVPIVRCGDGTDLALTEFELQPRAGEQQAGPGVIKGQPRLGG